MNVTPDMIKLLTPKTTKYMTVEPTIKQTAFLLMNEIEEVMYGGAAGGGKSIAQLLAALQYVDVPGYSAILFRCSYADLALPGALMQVAKQLLARFTATKEVKWSEKEKLFTFPSGATISFGYLENVGDCHRYQGAEFQYVGLDEATQIHPDNFVYMFSRLRKLKTSSVPIRMRLTTNPGGKYGEFYYERFFKNDDRDERLFIGAKLQDNPYLDAEAYIRSLKRLDPMNQAMLLDGSWDIQPHGDMFDRSWFVEIQPENIPSKARYVRYWDLASTDPNSRKRKDKRTPDSTVGFKLGMFDGIYYITDIVRVQKTPMEVENTVKETAHRDGFNTAIRMENEPGSSGDITIDHYARNVLQGFDFAGVRSTGSKVERARGCSAASQSGLVLVSANCRNKQVFYEEASIFPNGIKDDTIDGFSGAFNYFRNNVVLAAPNGISKSNNINWSQFRGDGFSGTYARKRNRWA